MAYHWYLSFCYFCILEPHRIHKASNHPVITKLMHHFYLQHPPFRKRFDPWDVEHLLSLWKFGHLHLLLLPLSWLGRLLLFWHLLLQSIVLIKPYYVLMTSTFFFSVMLLFSFPCLVARQIVWIIFPLRFILSLTPMLIFALFFI